MKKETAVKQLRDMLFMIQKFRSNAHDPVIGPNIPDSILNELMPWVFDNAKCPIAALVQILDHYDATSELAQMDYFNMMFILYRFAPTLVAFAPMLGIKSIPAQQPTMMECLAEWD